MLWLWWLSPERNLQCKDSVQAATTVLLVPIVRHHSMELHRVVHQAPTVPHNNKEDRTLNLKALMVLPLNNTNLSNLSNLSTNHRVNKVDSVALLNRATANQHHNRDTVAIKELKLDTMVKAVTKEDTEEMDM